MYPKLERGSQTRTEMMPSSQQLVDFSYKRRSDRYSCVTATIAVVGILAGFGCAPEDTTKVAETPDAEYRTLSEAEYEDKVAGGWLGQAIGVLYGFPTEFLWPGEMVPFDFDDWYRMKPGVWLEEGLSVLEKDGYIAMLDTKKKYKNDINNWETYTPGQMPPQDDLYIEFLFLHSLREHGLDVTAEQMAEDWVSYLDPNMIWGANRVAYQNFKKGILPPRSGHPDNTPLGNAIDFQIESDLFGLISPGLPRASNALGDRAGHLMNYGDGVYAGIAIGAMYGEAFFESDPRKLVEHSLTVIPRASGYAEMVRDVIAAHDANPDDWQAAWEVIFAKWGQYLGLDGRTVVSTWGCSTVAVTEDDEHLYACGLDSDCNPSTRRIRHRPGHVRYSINGPSEETAHQQRVPSWYLPGGYTHPQRIGLRTDRHCARFIPIRSTGMTSSPRRWKSAARTSSPTADGSRTASSTFRSKHRASHRLSRCLCPRCHMQNR